MAVTLGRNIASLSAIRQLSETSEGLSATFRRLSSGQRIASAADDAAGLAVSSTLHMHGRVYAQAVRNISDGISLLNVADGALSALASVVQRIQELAEQAANGTLSPIQRQSLDVEGQALRDEYNRIIRSTTFNGIALLNGEVTDTEIQLGFGSEESLKISIGSNIRYPVADGTFTAGDVIATGGYAFEVADLNGDGLDDIGYSTGSLVHIRLGNGDGTF